MEQFGLLCFERKKNRPVLFFSLNEKNNMNYGYLFTVRFRKQNRPTSQLKYNFDYIRHTRSLTFFFTKDVGSYSLIPNRPAYIVLMLIQCSTFSLDILK